MSKYTTQLRWVVEQKLKDLSLDNDESNWPEVYDTLGLADYPVYDPVTKQETTGECSARTRLNDKIIREYYQREIGLETVGSFRHYLRAAMFLVMPYYNQLYESCVYDLDPLNEYDFTGTETRERTEHEDEKRTGETSSTSDSTGTSSDENVYSDTPENMLDSGKVANKQYATNLAYDDTSTTDNTKTSSESTDTQERNRTENENVMRGEKGRRTPAPDLILKLRRAIINVDEEVVRDRNVQQCFMEVF